MVDDVFDQISTTSKKIKTKDSKVKGNYPVVDQGKELINGYHDNKDKLISVDKPVIIFGDHTRCLKWIPFSFVPGADGVKVLKPNSYISEKFSLYQLQSIQIKDRGYGRHFKLLKESKFYVIPELEQKELVKLLDIHLTTVSQIQARLDAIPKLIERFRQSVLNDAANGQLTQDWRRNNKISDWEWLEWYEITTKDKGAFKRGPFGSSLTKSMFVESGYKVYEQYCPINDDCSYARYYITPEKFEEMQQFEVLAGDLLISCSGVSLGRITKVPEIYEKGIINQALLRVRLNHDIYNSDFFIMLFRSPLFQEIIFNNSTGSAIPNLKATKLLKQIPVPNVSLAEQEEIVKRVQMFFEFANQIDKSLTIAKARIDNLTQSILHQAFTGNLTAEWREQNPELISGENSAEALLAKIKAEKQYSGKKLGKA